LKPAFLKPIIFVAVLILILNRSVVAQPVNEIKINETFQNQPLKDFLTVLHEKYGLKVFYKESWINTPVNFDINI